MKYDADFRPIDNEPDQAGTAQQIVDGAYAFLGGRARFDESKSNWREDSIEEITVPLGEVVVSHVCSVATETALVSAHNLGVRAMWEGSHGHNFVSFSDPKQPPRDDDLILCLTPGQFNVDWPQSNDGVHDYYFGPRKGLAPLVNGKTSIDGHTDDLGSNYANYYAPDAIRSRSPAYSPKPLKPGQSFPLPHPHYPKLYDTDLRYDHLLQAGPNDWADGKVPMGEITQDERNEMIQRIDTKNA